MAQSKRELTHDIVKAALYGPAAAKIPAPKINLAAVPVTQLNTAVAAPGPRPGAVAPIPSQSVGYRGPPVPTNSTVNQQHFTHQGSQLMRPPQAVSASSPHPAHTIPTRGFSSGGVAVRANSSNIEGDWSTETLNGPSGGSVLKVSSHGVGFSAILSGFESAPAASKASLPPRPQAPSGAVPAKPPVKDTKQQEGSRNGFASDSIFGGDVFSAIQSQPRQGPSAVNATVLTAASSPSSATQSSAIANALDSLKQVPQGPSLTPSLFSTSGNSRESENYSSSQSQMPWPKMTQIDVQKYMKVFVEVDMDKDGKITGDQARNLFLSWRLPRGI